MSLLEGWDTIFREYWTFFVVGAVVTYFLVKRAGDYASATGAHGLMKKLPKLPGGSREDHRPSYVPNNGHTSGYKPSGPATYPTFASASFSLDEARRTCERLETRNADLSQFKVEAMADKTQRELREATLATLREQHDAQKQFATHYKEQCDATQQKLASAEAALADAKRTISTDSATIAGLKDKIASLSSELKALEAVVSERTLASERAKQSAALAEEKQKLAEAKVADLRQQVADTVAKSAKMTEQLRQSEDALLHMQRIGSNAGGVRLWSHASRSHADVGGASIAASIAGKYGSVAAASTPPVDAPPVAAAAAPSSVAASNTPSVPAPATAGLFRDFARGSTQLRTPTPGVPASAADAAADAAPVTAPTATSFAHGRGAFNASGASLPGFDGASKVVPAPAAAAARTSGVPTSAYFPSLDE